MSYAYCYEIKATVVCFNEIYISKNKINCFESETKILNYTVCIKVLTCYTIS